MAERGAGADNGRKRVSAKRCSGTTSLAYDYEGRVTGITYPNSSTNSFTYNGLDTRVGKVDSAGTATYKRDGAGVTAPVLSDGSAAYTPGLSQRVSSTSTFFHGGIKNTDTQTNASKSVTATRVYDAFGNVASSTGTWSSPFGYAGPFGYQEDSDSGLKLLGHRYYDSSTGRFLNRDEAMDGRNWFVYTEPNPLRNIDPNGRTWIVDDWLAINAGLTGSEIIPDPDGGYDVVGGIVSHANVSGNVVTIGPYHYIRDRETYDRYRNDQQWRDHEQQHTKQYNWMGPAAFAVAYVDGAIIGALDEVASGSHSTGGPVGHDSNPLEIDADNASGKSDRPWWDPIWKTIKRGLLWPF